MPLYVIAEIVNFNSKHVGQKRGGSARTFILCVWAKLQLQNKASAAQSLASLQLHRDIDGEQEKAARKGGGRGAARALKLATVAAIVVTFVHAYAGFELGGRT